MTEAQCCTIDKFDVNSDVNHSRIILEEYVKGRAKERKVSLEWVASGLIGSASAALS